MHALILGNHTPSALAAVRELGLAGWTVGVGTPVSRGVATASRWCARWHEVRSPAHDFDGFVADVNRAIDAGGYEILFTSGDAESMAISHARASLHAKVPYAPHHVLQRAFDKLEMLRVAEAAGVPVPRTVEASEAALPGFTGGIVIKSRLHWEPGRDNRADRVEVRIARDRDAARNYTEGFRRAHAAAIYQEFKDGHLMGFTVLTDQDAEVVAQLQQMAPFTWDPGVPARAYTVTVDTQLARCIAAMMKHLGWFGMVQLQLIHATDGKPYLIDFNGRAYMSEALALAAGINFHDLWARIATGRPWQRPAPAKTGVHYQWLEGDIRRSMAGRDRSLPAKIWNCIRYSFGATHPIWARRDPRPIAHYAPYPFRRVKKI
ncbi:MAG: carboxylate--amine ligase [Betaproteobacteria bacterium]